MVTTVSIAGENHFFKKAAHTDADETGGLNA